MRPFHPRHEVPEVKNTAALVLLAFAAGCSDPPPPPAAPAKPAEAPKPATPPKPAKPNMAPPLSDAQNAAIAKAFTEARALAKEAEAAKAEGDRIEKAQGRDAANATLVKAKDLYHKALENVSDWTDGDLGGKVTDAQLKDYLGTYVSEVGKWQKAISDIGKVHKD